MNGYVTSAALQAEPEREEVPPAAAETELVSTELPANETPVLAASSSAGSRDIVEEVALLHILAQLLVHMDPENDPVVAQNRQWHTQNPILIIKAPILGFGISCCWIWPVAFRMKSLRPVLCFGFGISVLGWS